MPIDQSEAVILRTQNFAEQDKLVVFFSREKGLVRGIAKGARKFNNRFGSSLEPLSIVRIFYYEKERHDLVTISNCDLLESAFEMFTNRQAACFFSYLAELTEKFSPYRAGEEKLYRLLVSLVRAARAGQRIELLVRYFEYWFLKINGILPDFQTCQKCHGQINNTAWLEPQKDGVLCARCARDKKFELSPRLVRAIDWMKKNPPETPPGVELEAEDWKKLGRVFQAIIVFHLEERPRTMDLLDL
ncbi:MAG: DNA repair protein RecO [Candidatus Saccharicenans sp.]|nr:DNA repair protein RecO [Candidatus Saccharicenans sp.]